MYNRLLLIASLALATNAHGQSTDDTSKTSEPRWYQIEVIIFQNLAPNSSEQERWGDIIDFTADETSLSLNDINTVTEDDDETTDNSDSDSTEPDADTLADNPIAGTEDELLEETREPLIYQDKQQRMLNKHAAALEKNKNYQVMFHQSWLMVFNEGEKSAPLLITAGEAFDQHHQLEGSLDIQLSRLLHVKSDLWLSSFSESFNNEDSAYSYSYATDESSIPSYKASNSSSYGSFGDNSFKYQKLMANEYDVDQTANLKKHSRLKSNELHYVDHPLMGMLIKINRAEEITDTSNEL